MIWTIRGDSFTAPPELLQAEASVNQLDHTIDQVRDRVARLQDGGRFAEATLGHLTMIADDLTNIHLELDRLARATGLTLK